MSGLSLVLQLQGAPVLVVGGGPSVADMAQRLAPTGAAVTCVSPSLPEGLPPSDWVWVQRRFRPSDVTPLTRLVLLAADGPELRTAVAHAAAQLHVPFCAPNAPQLSTALLPEIVARGAVQCAVSAPPGPPSGLSAHIARAVDAALPHRLGALLQFAQQHSAEIGRAGLSAAALAAVWEEVFHGRVGERVLGGEDAEACALLRMRLLHGPGAGAVGEVYLVGAGPGDPDLLTPRALRLLKKADVVVYDRLIPPGLVARARPDAERVYVGKAAGAHSKTQAEINALLVRYALQGKSVCRLKGGDPFIFGRGGEEMEALLEHEVPFQVVPGITAATGCACAAHIPLTHRDYAQSVRFVTGHLKDAAADMDWRALAAPRQTVVLYMALGQLAGTAARLMGAGVPGDRPAAIIAEGTLPTQRIAYATVGTLAEVAESEGLRPPAVVIIGDVVTVGRKGRDMYISPSPSADDWAHA